MAEFRNERYPELQITGSAGKVRFSGGRFATDDPALVEALEALPEWYGVKPVDSGGKVPQDGAGGGGEQSGPDGDEPPARSAVKADWLAYARTRVGDSEEEAALEGLTKDQLIERYGGPADG